MQLETQVSSERTYAQTHTPPTLTPGSSRKTAAGEMPETYKEGLSCVASGQELEEKSSLSLFSQFRQQTNAIFPVLRPPHTQPNLNFHWPGESLMTYSTLVTCWDSTPHNLSNARGSFGAGRQPLLACTAVFLGQL